MTGSQATEWIMGKTQFSLDPALQYMCEHSLRLSPVQQKLIKVTSEHPYGRMIGSADEMQFLSNLVKTIKAKKTLDVGVFTGFSSLSIAQVLPPDGKVIALDVSEEYTNIGKPFWKEAGVDHKIDLRIAPAKDSLEKLVADGQSGTFDFAFIDADKLNYCNYYELCLELVRPGGIIAVDNVMWGKKVLDPDNTDPGTEAIRALNRKIRDDQRVDVSMLSMGDGVTLAFKK